MDFSQNLAHWRKSVQQLNISDVLNIMNLSSVGARVCKFFVFGKLMYTICYGDVALSAVALRAQNATNSVIIYNRQHIGLHIFIRTTSAFRTIVCYLLLAMSSRVQNAGYCRYTVEFQGCEVCTKTWDLELGFQPK